MNIIYQGLYSRNLLSPKLLSFLYIGKMFWDQNEDEYAPCFQRVLRSNKAGMPEIYISDGQWNNYYDGKTLKEYKDIKDCELLKIKY